MIVEFYTWLVSFTPSAQVAIALIIAAGAGVFLVVFLLTPDEQRRIRWIVSVTAAFLASMIMVAIVNIARIVWDL